MTPMPSSLQEKYKLTIGIEVHVQLKTQSKIFCSCSNMFGSAPNSNICVVCTGQPGTLPSLNRQAVEYAIVAGLATNCSIAKVSRFARKHYTYPDLPKNYQITQSDKPLCSSGYVTIELADGTSKKIRIRRIHLEEDAGKSTHHATGHTHVDLNRAGTPLIEIVSEPDIESSAQARSYLQRLRSIMQYIKISEVNMEEGSFRADINISVAPLHSSQLGTRVELKNINSFKFIVAAIEYEQQRQIKLLEEGEKVRQETRLWDPKAHISAFMRSKEEAEDYRYLDDPDLPLIITSEQQIKRMREQLPELPGALFERLRNQYGLSMAEAETITADRELALFFEEVAIKSKHAKQAANWILRNYLAYLNEHRLTIAQMKVTADMLAELISEIDKGVINSTIAQEVFEEMAIEGTFPSIIIQQKDLAQIGSESELEAIVQRIIEDHPEVAAQYKSGNEKVFGFLVGQAMKATKGKGNPQILSGLFKKKLNN